MSDFTEFDEQGVVPEKNTSAIISHAFEMYKGTFVYILVAALIYFGASFLINVVTGFDSQELTEEIKSGDYSTMRLFEIPGFTAYYGLSALLGILITPLYVGVIYILNKYNNKDQIQIGDLFIGYRQNVGNILIYSIVTNIILSISVLFCIIPVFLVFPLFLLGYPILLFENASFMDAIKKSYAIAKENYGVFLGSGLLGVLISMAGLLLCCVGIIVTMFFSIAVMYSLYVAYCGKPRPLLK